MKAMSLSEVSQGSSDSSSRSLRQDKEREISPDWLNRPGDYLSKRVVSLCYVRAMEFEQGLR